jgi:hypothetical protein
MTRSQQRRAIALLRSFSDRISRARDTGADELTLEELDSFEDEVHEFLEEVGE